MAHAAGASVSVAKATVTSFLFGMIKQNTQKHEHKPVEHEVSKYIPLLLLFYIIYHGI